MKRLYKIIIFTLFLYISIACQIKSSIAATTSGECGDNLKWTYDDQCEQLIISGQGTMEDYTSSANTPWNKYRKDIKKLTLGEGVTHIGNNAFGWCESLANIEFSDTIISLGEGCFERCKSLSDISLPSNVIEIGSRAFYLGNTLLNSVSIPKSIKKIGYCAFYCDDLNSVYYNGTIDEWASVEFAGYQANPVYYSNNLYINNSLITDVKLKIIDYNPYAFSNMKTLQKMQFAIGTTKIYKETLKNCINIESIIIPNSVTDIGESAFYGCESLKYIEIPSNIDEIKDYTFYNCKKLEKVIVPSSVTKIGRYAFYNCDSLRGVTFEKGELSRISEYAFAYCGIENIQIPDTVTFIGEDAFRENKKLKNIVLPKEMETISKYVFAGSGLEYFIVPTSIKTIEDYAFSMCDKLKYVAIPPEVEKIGDESFDSCGEYVQISDDEKQYVNGSFIIKGEKGSYAEEYAISKSPEYGFEIHAYFIDEVVVPSCKEYGYTRYKCALCSEQKNADYTDRTNKHEVVIDELIAPTCTKPGLTAGSHCSVCNEVLQAQEEIPALGHTWNAGEVTTAPTYTTVGVKTFTCKICGETRTESIPKLSRIDISKATSKVKVSGISAKIYNGKSQTQSALVVTVNGKKLKKDTDYSVVYSNNKNIGTATITITGKNGYTGTVRKTFAIKTQVGKVYTTSLKYKVTNARVDGKGTVSVVGSAYKIGDRKFTTLKIADTVTIGGVKFKITRIEKNAFRGYKYLTTVTIGSNVTSVGDTAFYGCGKLTTVTVGKRVKTIGAKSFAGCKSLKRVKLLTIQLTKAGTSAFNGIKSNATFALPKKYYNSYSKMIKKAGAPKKAEYKKF